MVYSLFSNINNLESEIQITWSVELKMNKRMNRLVTAVLFSISGSHGASRRLEAALLNFFFLSEGAQTLHSDRTFSSKQSIFFLL